MFGTSQEAQKRRDFEAYTPKLLKALEDLLDTTESLKNYRHLRGMDIIVSYCVCSAFHVLIVSLTVAVCSFVQLLWSCIRTSTTSPFGFFSAEIHWSCTVFANDSALLEGHASSKQTRSADQPYVAGVGERAFQGARS